MPRGGARQGAGRPNEGGTKSVARRVPKTLPDTEILEDMLELLKLTKEESKGKTGPRWEKIQKLIEEVEEKGLKL